MNNEAIASQRKDTREISWRPVLAVAVSTLALSACGANTSPENSSETPLSSSPQPSLSASPAVSPAESSAAPEKDSQPGANSSPSSKSPENIACTTPKVPVYPKLHFKQSNSVDIQRQLDSLSIAHQPNAAVSLRNIINAGSIVIDSISDPVYASAFTYANRRTDKPLTSEDLLSRPFQGGAVSCLQDRQIRQTGELYDALVGGLAPKAGRQLSALARAAYDQLRVGYRHFKAKYHEELGQ